MATKTTPALMVCIEAHVNDLGLFPDRSKIRADHPDVAKCPDFWVPDGLSDDEMHRAVHEFRSKMERIRAEQRAAHDRPGLLDRAANWLND